MLAMAKKMRFLTTVTTNGMLHLSMPRQPAGKPHALLGPTSTQVSSTTDPRRSSTWRPGGNCTSPLYIVCGHLTSLTTTSTAANPVAYMSSGPSCPEPLLLLLRQRRPRPGEGAGTPQVCRATGRHHRPGPAPPHRGWRKRLGQTRLPGSDVCRRHLPGQPAVAALLPLPAGRHSHQERPVRVYTTHPAVQDAKRRQGHHDFCTGCTVYCYMRSRCARSRT